MCRPRKAKVAGSSPVSSFLNFYYHSKWGEIIKLENAVIIILLILIVLAVGFILLMNVGDFSISHENTTSSINHSQSNVSVNKTADVSSDSSSSQSSGSSSSYSSQSDSSYSSQSSGSSSSESYSYDSGSSSYDDFTPGQAPGTENNGDFD